MIYLRDKYKISSGIVIGDRPIDIEAGQAAGLATHLFEDIVTLRQVLEM
ncbi:phosphoglycolate phosphatase [Streptococcus infantis SK1302]|uniref:Phosphoglycolate phosphatase n=2 Tax=Streptococcus TaxID=1301 RepID=A0ABP2J7C4_9STRE|nr:phosphoglycolate phosphatase [Streptococcus infantis SK1302]